MRTYEVATSVTRLRKEVVVVMVRDKITTEIANALKEEVPNLRTVSNSSELSEFIEEHLPTSEVFVVTDVTYKFVRGITDLENISWVGCEVHTLS